jgi:fructokinase
MRPFKIVGLGEVLWDLLPGQKQAGGAPANFAYISTVLGDTGIVASRIGADDLGAEMLSHLQSRGLITEHIQTDPKHLTGTVNVQVHSDGQPLFAIAEPSAWDFLELTSAWKQLARSADAICFGTLAQRNPQSRATIQRFLASARTDSIRVFDINLRQHFYSAEILKQSLEIAQIVKLNQEEVAIACDLFNAPTTESVQFAEWLQKRFHLKLVCITFGAEGSLLVAGSSHHRHSGYRVKVADTVGSGDAFTAAMLHHYLRGLTLPEINRASNIMGSLVASKNGAMPTINRGEIESYKTPNTP